MKDSVRTIACNILFVAGVVAVSVVAFASAKSTKDGAFTTSQAERGKAIYEKSCEGCHKPDIQVRLSKFEGRPVSEMLEVVSTAMPADNPGSLALSEYLDASPQDLTPSFMECTVDTQDPFGQSPLGDKPE
jgi:hypothetical protein